MCVCACMHAYVHMQAHVLCVHVNVCVCVRLKCWLPAFTCEQAYSGKHLSENQYIYLK